MTTKEDALISLLSNYTELQSSNPRYKINYFLTLSHLFQMHNCSVADQIFLWHNPSYFTYNSYILKNLKLLPLIEFSPKLLSYFNLVLHFHVHHPALTHPNLVLHFIWPGYQNRNHPHFPCAKKTKTKANLLFPR